MLRKLSTLLLSLVLSVLAPYLRGADELLPQKAYDVLQKNCFTCHGALKVGGLDLRTRDSIATGGARGAAIVPSDPERSLLYRFASHEAEPTMPPGQKLSDDDIDLLRRWILEGASFEGVEEAGGESAERAAQDQAALAKLEERPITEDERAFWAYKSRSGVTRPASLTWAGRIIPSTHSCCRR